MVTSPKGETAGGDAEGEGKTEGEAIRGETTGRKTIVGAENNKSGELYL